MGLLCCLDMTTLLVAGIIFLLGWLALVKPKGIPPGPAWRIPLLGHVHLLQGDVLSTLKHLRKEHGDIFHLYLGPKVAVFLNGYEVIREALVKHADVFSDRPNFGGSEAEKFGNGKGLITSSGETWKEHRKFALGALREFGFGRNILQEKVSEEVSKFLSAVEDTKEQAFDVKPLLHNAVSNNICSIVFGNRYEYDDPKFQKFLQVLDKTFRAGRTLRVALGRLTKYLPGDLVGYKEAMSNVQFLRKELVEASLEAHLATFDPDNLRDFIDAYIKEMKAKEREGVATAINQDQLWRVVLDLFAAGSETTSTTISWALIFLLNYPDLQERLFQELQDKVGQGRLPGLEDRAGLPLLEAFILEVQRRADIVPLNIPHAAAEDITFHGYLIPKGTMVFPLLDSVLNDPQVWGDPEVFRPERFLQDGQVVKPEEFIPFSLGRRVCLGESLAKMELFLFLAAMIQRFRFEPPENQPPPEIKGVVGTTHNPNSFKMRAVRRQ